MHVPPVALIGATGFLGRHLAAQLAADGIPVTGLSRSSGHSIPGVTAWQSTERPNLTLHQAVINLAGEPVNCRWTPARKQSLRASRIDQTNRIVDHIHSLPQEHRPALLVNASGIGYYGDGGDTPLDESSPPGQDFLAKLCMDWESAALRAQDSGLRVVLLRTGMVLGRKGAAFTQLRRVFSLGLGGRIGSGKQWLPWIHLDDEISAILHILRTPSLRGPVNLCSPWPETNNDFTRKFASALHRPALFPAPSFALKILLGEFSQALLTGQRGVPAALQSTGFRFHFPDLESALEDLLA